MFMVVTPLLHLDRLYQDNKCDYIAMKAASSDALAAGSSGGDRESWERKLLSLKSSRVVVTDEIKHLRKKLSRLEEENRALVSGINGLQEKLDRLPNSQHGEWSKPYKWDVEVRSALRTFFGIQGDFRTHQREAINATMCGKDVFLIKSTGGGKSICFQIPALLEDGFTLVVSPLVSLSHDQVFSLREKCIHAAVLDANTDREVAKAIFSDIVSDKSKLKLLYVTPEKIVSSKRFFHQLQKSAKFGLLRRIVIDEAHCVSQWGSDFRPAYRSLELLRTSQSTDTVPLMALTATATMDVREDVQSILKMRHTEVFLGSFNRPNLIYSVQSKGGKLVELVASIMREIELCQHRLNDGVAPSGLVYVHSRQDAEKMATALLGQGVRALPYHAGLEDFQKQSAHSSWRKGEVTVIVATVAFGMGIDKPNVRFVIHATLSKTMETYLQESGRAGRDGKPSRCTLFYRREDIAKVSSLVHGSPNQDVAKKKLYEFVSSFCESNGTTCRRVTIARSLGENANQLVCNGCCDVCLRSSVHEKDCFDASAAGKGLLQLIDSIKQNHIRDDISMIQLVDCWRGVGPIYKKLKETVSQDNIANLRSPAGVGRANLLKILVHMLLKGWIVEDFIATAYSWNVYVSISHSGRAWAAGQSRFTLFLDDEVGRHSKKKRKPKPSRVDPGEFGFESSGSEELFESIEDVDKRKLRKLTRKGKPQSSVSSSHVVIELLDSD